ncbi:MAG: glycosyltransferase, partial [Pseudomonadota bacterium]
MTVQQTTPARPIAVIAPDIATLQTAFLRELETLAAQGRPLCIFLPGTEPSGAALKAVSPALAADLRTLPPALMAQDGAPTAGLINGLSKLSSELQACDAGIVIGIGQHGTLLAGLAGAMADTPFRYGVLDEVRLDVERLEKSGRYTPRHVVKRVRNWATRQSNALVLRNGFRRIDGVLVRSQALRDQLQASGLVHNGQSCRVVPPPFDAETFDAAPLHAIGAGLNFLHIAAPGDRPSLAAFIASASAIAKHGGRAQFQIACLPGHAMIKGRLAEEAAAAKIEIYHLSAGERLIGPASSPAQERPVAVVPERGSDETNPTSHPAGRPTQQPLLMRLLADAHVCSYTPTVHGPLQPVLAALAMGRPLIVSDLPGLNALVHTHGERSAARPDNAVMTNGAVVAAGSAQELATAMAALLRRPDRIAAMCRASRTHALASQHSAAHIALGLGMLDAALGA